MPNPNALVARVNRIDPPLDRAPGDTLGFTIELEGDRRVRLAAGESNSAGRARILDGLRQLRRPVYLEIDPATAEITRLLIPRVTRVQGIRPLAEGVLSVELEQSHARHVLLRTTPDAAELEKLLRDALSAQTPVIVAETDNHEIIDVRPYTPAPGEDLPHFPKPEFPTRVPWSLSWLKEKLWRLGCWGPWRRLWSSCISMKEAEKVFHAMNAATCDPLTVIPPCIPFLYPDDGCWGRAHEMYRLMIEMGLTPSKVWIDGYLWPNTRNHPFCRVIWSWHVAPTLCVCGPGRFQAQQMVFDPALFTKPVTEAEWKAIQNDPLATLTHTAGSVFWLAGFLPDPGYVKTNLVLAEYRLELLNRSLVVGPPPYANCP